MSDLKISQLIPSLPITGAELVEVVQSGVNVQTTVNGLAASISPFVVLGNPTGPLTSSLANQFSWYNGLANVPGGGTTSAFNNFDNTDRQWQRYGNISAQGFTGNGSNIFASIQWSAYFTNAAPNSATGIYPAAQQGLITSSSPVALIRLASNGLLIGGFTMTAYVGFTSATLTQQFFFGFANAAGPLLGTQVPSALTNMIGLGRDSGDTNLQFMINNGAGSASKTDLGITPTQVLNQLLRLVITCDGAGNCAITLTNLENSHQYSINYPTATVKLPAASSGPGVNYLIPHFHINTGSGSTAVAFVESAIFITGGFGAI